MLIITFEDWLSIKIIINNDKKYPKFNPSRPSIKLEPFIKTNRQNVIKNTLK